MISLLPFLRRVVSAVLAVVEYSSSGEAENGEAPGLLFPHLLPTGWFFVASCVLALRGTRHLLLMFLSRPCCICLLPLTGDSLASSYSLRHWIFLWARDMLRAVWACSVSSTS